jgi:hypothetical protein
MKYRKKPVVIEAFQFNGTPQGALEVFGHFEIPGGKFVPDHDLRTGTLLIPTLEGDHTASRGDFIIKGIKGEFYPCKPDIFAATYEPVSEPEANSDTDDQYYRNSEASVQAIKHAIVHGPPIQNTK